MGFCHHARGGVGMITFPAVELMVDATQHVGWVGWGGDVNVP